MVRRRVVIAHRDWDGVVSALYAEPRADVFQALDYHTLDGASKAGERVFFEVYQPDILRPGDIVLDHHKPKLPLDVEPLTGYLAVYEEPGRLRLLAASRDRGRDYSNVKAVAELYDSREFVEMFPHSIRPPGDIIEASNILDNPPLGGREWLPVVLGYSVLWQTNTDSLIDRMRRAAAESALTEELRCILKQFRELGCELVEMMPRVELDTSAPLVVVAAGDDVDSAWGRLMFLAAEISDGLRRPLYVKATRLPDGRYKLLMVSPDETALQIAEQLGGGGRKTPDGGTVAGAEVPLEKLNSILEKRYTRVHVLHAEAPPELRSLLNSLRSGRRESRRESVSIE